MRIRIKWTKGTFSNKLNNLKYIQNIISGRGEEGCCLDKCRKPMTVHRGLGPLSRYCLLYGSPKSNNRIQWVRCHPRLQWPIRHRYSKYIESPLSIQ